MCGIAGVLSNGSQEHIETVVRRMQDALQHRGPDSQGIYISPDHQAALSHTRLAILDLSSSGYQPMSTVDGRYWITFNGEIYNFRELRSQLEAQGEQFQSQTDTEVILKLYEQVGTDCVNQLRGMFAFAIWDDFEKTCFLARDPLGIKPLYYWQSNSTLLFASELRAILASKLPSINLSPEGLYGYLMSGSVPEPYTLIQDVRCLEAGHWLYWKAGQLTKKRYWQINFSSELISLPEAAERVRQALFDSIKYHFVSDVPVGAFLSGGIDSTVVVAIASQIQSSKLHTYSIAFEEPEWNEGEVAQKVAEKFETEHTEYKVTATLGQELFPKFLQVMDQPSIDGFNTFCVSQLAHNNGAKVVLSGLGGDELFGGYGSFQKVPQMVRWSRQLQPLHLVLQGVGMGLETWGRSTQVKRLGDFLQQSPNTANAYRSFRGIFSHREACAIARQYLPEQLSFNLTSTAEINGQALTIEDEVSLLELSYYMRNQLLRDSDVMSMAWGLELRVPLVDRVLLETIASIPSQFRLAPGKKLLVQAVPELPDWVVNRPKKGFFFPFEKWMAQEWQATFSQVQCPLGIVLKPWYRRWSLTILQLWWQQITA